MYFFIFSFHWLNFEIVDKFFWHLCNPYHWPGVLMNRWRKGEYTILNVWSNLKMGSYSTQSLDKYKYKYKSKCSKSRPATASTLIEANSMDSWTKSEWQYLKDEGRWQYLFELLTCFPFYTKTVLPFCNCQIRRLLIQLHRTPEKESLTSDWLEDRSLLKPFFEVTKLTWNHNLYQKLEEISQFKTNSSLGYETKSQHYLSKGDMLENNELRE